MKKYIILLMVGIFAFVNSSADIYTSVSKKIEINKEKKEKAPIQLHWYGKAGINIGVTKGDLYFPLNSTDVTPRTFGLDLNPGFYCFFQTAKPSDFYWGADMNVGVNLVNLNEGNYEENWSFGGSYSYFWNTQNIYLPYINIAPQLGWRKKLSNYLDFDIHIEPAGMYVSHACWHKYKEYHDGEFRFDNQSRLYGYSEIAGFSKIGLGVWYKKTIFDISYQQPWPESYPATITLGVGLQF